MFNILVDGSGTWEIDNEEDFKLKVMLLRARRANFAVQVFGVWKWAQY